MTRLSLILAAAALGLATAQPAQAASRALLIGIDRYAAVPPLKGAANDVADLAGVLERAGIPAVRLVDAAATRAAVVAAFDRLVAESAPGDLLLVHFSGHGISIPDDDGDEADGRDESYLLQGFDEVAAPGEQLVDDDIDRLFRRATALGRAVLFVADACHSGSPARAVAADGLPTRLYRPKTDPTRPPPPAAPPAADAAPGAVMVAGATLDDRTIPEMLIDGAPRGALSFAVARALEGRADLDGDGVVTAAEFEVFVRQSVRTLAASKQTPQFAVADGSRPILAVAAGSPQTRTADGTLAPITVHVRPGAGEPAATAALSAVEGVRLVGAAEAATLVVDPAQGAVFNAVRDRIAGPGQAAEDLGRVVEAARVLEGLGRLALAAPLAIAFSPDDAVQPLGSRIAFDVEGLTKPHLTVFDLTATGSVHRLWPLDGDPDPWPLDRPFRLEAAVTPPFGADTLVVLATDAPPEALRAALSGDKAGLGPAALWAALNEATAGRSYQLGLQTFLTAEERNP